MRMADKDPSGGPAPRPSLGGLHSRKDVWPERRAWNASRRLNLNGSLCGDFPALPPKHGGFIDGRREQPAELLQRHEFMTRTIICNG